MFQCIGFKIRLDKVINKALVVLVDILRCWCWLLLHNGFWVGNHSRWLRIRQSECVHRVRGPDKSPVLDRLGEIPGESSRFLIEDLSPPIEIGNWQAPENSIQLTIFCLSEALKFLFIKKIWKQEF